MPTSQGVSSRFASLNIYLFHTHVRVDMCSRISRGLKTLEERLSSPAPKARLPPPSPTSLLFTMAFVHGPVLQSSSTPSSLTLISREGTLYHVDANILRLNSNLFDTMLTLPAPGHCSSKEAVRDTSIEVFEQDATLSQFLRLVDGGSIRWTRIENAYPILELVEKWDCTLLLRRLRDQLSLSHIPRTQPLRFFALAHHFEWTEEARQASTYTLSLDLEAPEHAVIMEQLPRRAAQSLLDLRRQRSAQFRRLLDNPTRFPGGNSYVSL